ncbi:hypothetical protein ACFP81_10665 [Deinococcus lacus]|uniref:Uncharacterized protein n=1 Tax=Deinococcus lacus TaxID=392561 RepID=A0ABW1YDJ2_9DEIO
MTTAQAPAETADTGTLPPAPDPEPTPPVKAEEKKPVETFLKPLPRWKQAALKAKYRWPVGYPITKTDFDQAPQDVLGEVIA